MGVSDEQSVIKKEYIRHKRDYKSYKKHYKKHYKTLQKTLQNTTKKDYKKRFCTDSAQNLYGVRAFCAEYQGECKVLTRWYQILSQLSQLKKKCTQPELNIQSQLSTFTMIIQLHHQSIIFFVFIITMY